MPNNPMEPNATTVSRLLVRCGELWDALTEERTKREAAQMLVWKLQSRLYETDPTDAKHPLPAKMVKELHDETMESRARAEAAEASMRELQARMAELRDRCARMDNELQAARERIGNEVLSDAFEVAALRSELGIVLDDLKLKFDRIAELEAENADLKRHLSPEVYNAK